ncbi:hypothetical protein ACGFIW_01120, partial [Micromonospora sp. NPDC048935]|uniref:hypothetical protein n=1 Tax=Micromonospora sp. NPDC048935 TaxID=3364262 RepID=UPI00371AF1EE
AHAEAVAHAEAARDLDRALMPVLCALMGAIKPWHIAVLCCLVTSVALIGGLVALLVKRGNRR